MFNYLHSQKLQLFIIFILVLILSTVSFLPWIDCPYPSQDLAQTVYQAKRLLMGAVPHRDMFCHHVQGYIIPFAIFDYFIPLTQTTIKVFAIIFHFFYVVSAYWAVGKIFNRSTGLIAAFVTATLGLFPAWHGATFNAQNYLLPFMMVVLGLTTIASQRYSKYLLYALAIIFGLTCLIDQRFVLYAPLLFVPLYSLESYRNFRTLVTYLFCCSVFPVIYFIYLGLNGAFFDMVDQALIYPLTARNNNKPVNFSETTKLLYYGIKVYFAIILFSLFGLILMIRSEQRRYILLMVVNLTISGLLYLLVSGRSFPNYLMVFSPLLIILLSATAYYSISSNNNQRRSYSFPVIILCFASIIASVAKYYESPILNHKPDTRIRSKIATTIKEVTEPSDEIVVWGGYGMSIYLESERFTSFRDPSFISVTGAHIAPTEDENLGTLPKFKEEFVFYMTNKKPKIFVYYLPNIKCVELDCFDCGAGTNNMDFKVYDNLKYLKELIDRNYRLLTSFESEYDYADLYILKTQ